MSNMAESIDTNERGRLGRRPSGTGDVMGSVPKNLSAYGRNGALERPVSEPCPSPSGENANQTVGDKNIKPHSVEALEDKTLSAEGGEHNCPDQPPLEYVRAPLALSESISDATMDPLITGPLEDIVAIPEQEESPRTDSGHDVSNHSEKSPMLEKSEGTSDDVKGGPSRRYGDKKPPVEVILIDKSNKDSAKLRIDEHMNVSLYKEGSGYKRAIIGVIVFCVLVLTMTLVVALGRRNHVNQHEEIRAIVHSLDSSSTGSHPLHMKGWNVWHHSIPPSRGHFSKHSEMKKRSVRTENSSQTISYILVRDDFEDVRLLTADSFIITYQKGCFVKVTVDVVVNNARLNTSHVFLGDPADATEKEVLLTYQGAPPEGVGAEIYLHFDLGFDGYRTYSLFTLYTHRDVFSDVVFGSFPEQDMGPGRFNCTGGEDRC